MKPIGLAGIVVAALGLVALLAGSFSFTKTEQVAEIGGLEMSVKEKETVTVPPLVGILLLVGGGVLVAMGRRK
jgi:hypothetical protein